MSSTITVMANAAATSVSALRRSGYFAPRCACSRIAMQTGAQSLIELRLLFPIL